jgi:group I intron endonuclease
MYCYLITNLVNGKQYVGIAINPERRWIEHKCGHGSKLLYSAIKKYGLSSFKYEILGVGVEQQIKELEIAQISKYKTVAPNGYNLTFGGEGNVGWKHSLDTRRLMSATRSGSNNKMFGRQHSFETKQLLSKRAKERKLTPDRLELLTRISKGANNGRAKPIEINGIKYEYIGQAALALGLKQSTLRTYVGRAKKKGIWPKSLRQYTINLLQKEN